MAQNVVINGITYSNVPEVNIPKSGGGTAKFMDTSDASLASGDSMLSGVTAYGDGIKYTGTIASKTSSDLTASGGTVTVPAGYYAANASKAITNGSATTPATSINVTPTITVSDSGLITASVTGSQNITPTISAGYISSGTGGVVTVSGSDTEQLQTKSSATYTPTTSDQTISAGQYLTGAQTISGDSNLVASNIKSGVSIFGVNGALSAAVISQDAGTKILSIS